MKFFNKQFPVRHKKCIAAAALLLGAFLCFFMRDSQTATDPAVELATPTAASTIASSSSPVRISTPANAAEMKGAPVLKEDFLQLNREYMDELFTYLSEKTKRWLDEISGITLETPAQIAEKTGMPDSDFLQAVTWKEVRLKVNDGDGNQISDLSNIQDLMSAINVYDFYENKTEEELFDYVDKLWEVSHSYSLEMSEVYYCSDCVVYGEENEIEENETEEKLPSSSPEQSLEDALEEETLPWNEEDLERDLREFSEDELSQMSGPGIGDGQMTDMLPAASSEVDNGNTAPSSGRRNPVVKTVSCPGHVDLLIQATVIGLEEENHLLSQNGIEPETSSGWNGWTEKKCREAMMLNNQDWEKAYGYLASYPVVFHHTQGQDPLTPKEMEQYLNLLPSDLSEVRYEMVKTALYSVGRIPYYWGGKPACAGYEGNRFGTPFFPDEKGRALKGLDCSGWVSWLYWTVTGEKLPRESTSGLVNCGKKISRKELQPGDIVIKTGADAHVILFLGWTPEGEIRCIHESSASVNNVSVSVMEADWPYYISLFP